MAYEYTLYNNILYIIKTTGCIRSYMHSTAHSTYNTYLDA